VFGREPVNHLQFATLAIRYDPTQPLVLGGAALGLLGLMLSLAGHRRRVWFRVSHPQASEPGGGGSLMEAGGLPRTDYPGFARWFFEAITTEPHSTKVIDDAVEWALDGSVDAMLADADAPFDLDQAAVEAICRAVTCQMLIVHGTEDHCQPVARAHRLAELTGAPLVVVEGADHMIPGRHPVLANLLIRDFVRSLEEGVT